MANQSAYHGRPAALSLAGHQNLKLYWPVNPRTKTCGPNPMQAEILKCESKHVGVTGGSASGKSLLGAMGFCSKAVYRPNQMGLVIGKDYNQIMGVQYKVIIMVLRWWSKVNGFNLIRHASEYQKRIVLYNGFQIIFRTATEIERIQGLEVQLVWCDEWAIWPDQRAAWNEINSRMRPPQLLPWAIWTSTPKGAYGIAAIFQDKCRVATSNPRVWTSEHTPEDQPYQGYSLYEMSTRENLAFDPSYVTGQLGNYSEEEAQAEIDGKIVTLAGSVFGKVFSPIHNVIPFTFDGSKHSLAAAIDHGSNYPYVALVARFQDDQGMPADCIIREYVKDNVRGVQDLIWWIDEQLRDLKVAKLRAIFPDPDKQYKRENGLLGSHFKCPVHAYSERDYRNISWGTGLVKARLLDALGQRHLFVSKDLSMQNQNTSVNGRGCCRGFLTQEWAENRSSKNVFEELADTWKDLPGTHAMDAIRYMVSHEYKYLAADGTYRKQSGQIFY